MAKPLFSSLWKNYPTLNKPCSGPWSDQCAIRMSITLNGDGTITVGRSTYTEPKCRHGHARGAESLANWLWRRHLGRPTIYLDGAEAKRKLKSKKGIIFFKDCFIRSGQARRQGDHIDLWRTGTAKTYDDPGNQAAQVWFWALS